MTRHLPSLFRRPYIRSRAKGFTLVEVMFGCAIGSLIALAALGSIVEGMQLFRSNSSEMIARDKGARAIRKISTDMQNASQIQVFPNYLSTTGSNTTYGSCAVLQGTNGSVAYYLYASNSSDPNSGGIYYCANAAVAPNPATDSLLVSDVQDFEFRSDISGSTRVGFKIGIYGFPTLSLGSDEADLVRYSTSNVPRNL